MKKLFAIGILIIGTLSGCKNPPKADEAKVTTPQQAQATENGFEYKVDLQKSNVQFTGVTPIRQQHGTFLLKEGKLTVKDSLVRSGYFIIDATSLAAFDEDGSPNSKLQNHLKSHDFFDVEKFQTARFEITNVQQGVKLSKDVVMKDATNTVTGNLKIKDVTMSISFPAKINVAAGKLFADASFNIDRTKWGINYGNDKSAGVKYIKPEINLKVHLEASH